MKPERLVVEHRNNRLALEERLLVSHADSIGLPVKVYSVKELARGHVKLLPTDIVSGSVLFIKHALRTLGKELPEEDNYPDCLKYLLHREITGPVKLRDVKVRLEFGKDIFVKPLKTKQFTGFVTCDHNDPRFNGASDNALCYTSNVVKFVSEWRCYVMNGIYMDIRFADFGGDRNIRPDNGIITRAIGKLTESGAPAAYAIDFGVLSTGETVLVEMNDGFSIGAYDGIPREMYWMVIRTRWQELITQ